MAAAKVLMTGDALDVGVLGLVVSVQLLVAVGTYFKMDLANALRAQMADGAVVFRRGKVVAIDMV